MHIHIHTQHIWLATCFFVTSFLHGCHISMTLLNLSAQDRCFPTVCDPLGTFHFQQQMLMEVSLLSNLFSNVSSTDTVNIAQGTNPPTMNEGFASQPVKSSLKPVNCAIARNFSPPFYRKRVPVHCNLSMNFFLPTMFTLTMVPVNHNMSMKFVSPHMWTPHRVLFYRVILM